MSPYYALSRGGQRDRGVEVRDTSDNCVDEVPELVLPVAVINRDQGAEKVDQVGRLARLRLAEEVDVARLQGDV